MVAFYTKEENIDSNTFTQYDNKRISVIQFLDKKVLTLNRIMLRFYVSKIKNKVDLVSGNSGGTSFNLLAKELKPELENIIMKYAIASYNNGGQYVYDTVAGNDNKNNNIPNLFFNMNSEDSRILEIAVLDLLAKFWYRIEQIERRNQQIVTKSGGTIIQKDIKELSQFQAVNNNNELIYIDNEGKIKERDNMLDYEAYISSKARMIIFTAYNLGAFNAPSKIVTYLEDQGNFNDIDYLRNSFMFRWKTKSNPDPIICLPLRDKLFPIDAKNIPIPQIDTHPHCRCILILVERK